MPRLPDQSLPNKLIGFVKKTTSKIKEVKVKNKFMVYSFASIILIDVASLFLYKLESYPLFIYPLLTQIDLFILCLTLAMYSERLRFCIRKETSIWVLSGYFLFNIIALVFQLDNYFYGVVVNLIMLSTAFVLLFSSLKR